MVLADLGVAPSLDLTPSSMVVFVEMHSNPKLMLRAEKCIQRRMGDGWSSLYYLVGEETLDGMMAKRVRGEVEERRGREEKGLEWVEEEEEGEGLEVELTSEEGADVQKEA